MGEIQRAIAAELDDQAQALTAVVVAAQLLESEPDTELLVLLRENARRAIRAQRRMVELCKANEEGESC